MQTENYKENAILMCPGNFVNEYIYFNEEVYNFSQSEVLSSMIEYTLLSPESICEWLEFSAA